jgi:hypothetical protein
MVGSSTRNPGEHLQGLATADQIVIATSTRRLVGRPANNSFEFIDLGEQGTGCRKELSRLARPGAGSRRNPGSCARRPASRGCGRGKVNAKMRIVARPGVWLVYRRLRHQGFAGSENAVG